MIYGHTQVDIATKLGIHKSAVCRMLSGAHAVRQSTVKRIADAIGRSEYEVQLWILCKRAGQTLPQ
jgi:DNA-binding LacI/PurR family transcriptional regulator